METRGGGDRWHRITCQSRSSRLYLSTRLCTQGFGVHHALNPDPYRGRFGCAETPVSHNPRLRRHSHHCPVLWESGDSDDPCPGDDRCRSPRDDGAAYAEDVADLLATATPGRVAAFVAESIQGVNGAVPLATGFLKAVYPKARGKNTRKTQTFVKHCDHLPAVAPDVGFCARAPGCFPSSLRECRALWRGR